MDVSSFPISRFNPNKIFFLNGQIRCRKKSCQIFNAGIKRLNFQHRNSFQPQDRFQRQKKIMSNFQSWNKIATSLGNCDWLVDVGWFRFPILG